MPLPKISYWMPFTANRDFKKQPRVVTCAVGHRYTTVDGTVALYDSFSGLWTSGLGHCHPKIVDAVQEQVATLDYRITFQVSNDSVQPRLARTWSVLRPRGSHSASSPTPGRSQSTPRSGSHSATTVHAAKPTRTRLIGREQGYHGVNFGGMSVGGMVPNRKVFSAAMIPGVDHLRHTLDIERNAFSRGLPAHGIELAEDLARLCALHDGSNIAAVIVEPVAGSAGVIPPPAGYLERLREICDEHGILLIFDEVIAAFGRLGHGFGAQRFGVTPDIITTAKGLTNGVIPMGAVLVREHDLRRVHAGPENMIELFHGYTYSGHPVAAAAGIATMDVYTPKASSSRSGAGTAFRGPAALLRRSPARSSMFAISA